MARGIKINLEEYFARLRPFLIEGCSLNESCIMAHVPYSTINDYRNADEEVRKKIMALQNTPLLAARKSLNRSAVQDGGLALKYLERKLKDEFSTKREISVPGLNLNEIFAGIDSEVVEMVKDLLKKDPEK